MKGLKRGWDLHRVRRVWAQISTGKKVSIAIWGLLLMGMPSVAYFQPAVDQQPPTITTNIPNDSLWLTQVLPQITVRDDTEPHPTFTVELDGEPYETGTPIREKGLHEL